MTAGPSLSVVLAARNEERRIGAQLDALSRQQVDGSWELVVVDDGSTDGTRSVVETYRSRLPVLQVVTNARPLGLVASVARGVGASRAPRIVFLDADDVVADGYLTAMRRGLEQHAIVCARLELERLNPGWVRHQREVEQVAGVMPWPGWLAWGHGCSLAVDATRVDVPRHIRTQLEAGDPLGWDVSFCWSAQLEGADIGFVPDAVLHYRFRDTLPAVYRQAVGYGRSQVPRFRHFRPYGMPRRGVGRALLGLAYTLARLVGVRGRADLARWLFDVGLYVGRARGSVAYRTLYL